MYEVTVTAARAEFSEIINRVAYGGESVVITRHGKPLVALVPAADLDEGSTRPLALLDVSATSREPSGPFTVAAHHRDDPKT